ncbi:putative SAGA complex subunit spt3 [Paratrimastix pyriformis]|uniref:SAGA complex subunit spt3 n=1 Tax=Paratrimastix pyriformis TaxID=342808 RepID=A0ABQ8UJQ7_9EUKA|nr:putative SAGA complex subunit spt3 [Paratrimastix pyriformis]
MATTKKRKPPPDGEATRKRQTPQEFSYAQEISKMMFTFGDAKYSDPRSLVLMETVVRRHLIEMCINAGRLSQQRNGTTKFSAEDLVFQTRHDVVRMNRLQEYLAWRECRKEVQKAAQKAEKDADTGDDEDEDLQTVTPGMGKGRSHPLPAPRHMPGRSFDLLHTLATVGPAGAEGEDFDEGLGPAPNENMQAPCTRLPPPPSATSHCGRWAMTREEYADFTEARQASFSHLKSKKFREWLQGPALGIKQLTDEVTDALSYLAWETVGLVTIAALKVKEEMEGQPQGVAGKAMCLSENLSAARVAQLDVPPAPLVPAAPPAPLEPPSSELPPAPLEGPPATPPAIPDSAAHLAATAPTPPATARSLGAGQASLHGSTPIMPAHLMEALRRLERFQGSPVAWTENPQGGPLGTVTTMRF